MPADTPLDAGAPVPVDGATAPRGLTAETAGRLSDPPPRSGSTAADTAVEWIEDRLDHIDGRLRLLEDRFDEMVAQLRNLGTDVADNARLEQHGATKEWIAWAVVTMLVVILGALWWALKIYILPVHLQPM